MISECREFGARPRALYSCPLGGPNALPGNTMAGVDVSGAIGGEQLERPRGGGQRRVSPF